MKVISTNIGTSTAIIWNEKEVFTGIFKYPTDQAIYLGTESVSSDTVVNLNAHGGKDKACYIYSSDHYEYWKKIYPNLDWQWGMMGENLTISGLDETKINIGDKFIIGQAIVQVSQPRKPCYKLGVRFESQDVVEQFRELSYCGCYVRIITPGLVKKNDEFILLEKNIEGLTIAEIHALYAKTNGGKTTLLKAINDNFLAESYKKDLEKILNTAAFNN